MMNRAEPRADKLREIAFGLCCVIVSGIGFILAFPGGPLPWIGWFSMVPLLGVLFFLSARRAMWLWTLYGVIFWAGSTYWMYPFLVYVIGAHGGLAILLLLIMWMISSIPYGITGYLAVRYLRLETFWGGFQLAALLAALVSWVPVPFPGDLSMSQFRYPLMVQVADIGGGHFVHFLLIWVNVLITQGLMGLWANKRIPRYSYVGVLAIFVFIIGYGGIRLREYRELNEGSSRDDYVKIASVQSNIPGADLSFIYGNIVDKDEEGSMYNSLELTLAALKDADGIDAVFWPESPSSVPFLEAQGLADQLYGLANAYDTSLFFISMYDPERDIGLRYSTGQTTLFRVDPGYKYSMPYQKAKLIPFTEYLPGEDYVPFLRKLFPLAADIEPGKNLDPIEVGHKLRFVPMICYEGIFPNFIRKQVGRGANVLVSLDNDTNFGYSKASEVHFSVLYYRVLENRIPMVRVNNAGVSSTVLSSGEIVKGSETPMFRRAYRVSEILPKMGGQTIYEMWGHWMMFLLVGIGAVRRFVFF